MKTPILFLFALSLHANTIYYIASFGSDMNNGLSKGSPFATVDKFNQTMGCGDVGMIASSFDGSSPVLINSYAKYIANCATNPILRSWQWDKLNHPGYRVTPAGADAPYLGNTTATYGSDGVSLSYWVEKHGTGIGGQTPASYFVCGVSVSGSTFTPVACNSPGGGILNGANGQQVSFQLAYDPATGNTYPTGMGTEGQKLYIVGCTSCTLSSGSWQVSLTPGGSAITPTCTSPCSWTRMYFDGNPLLVDPATDTFTITDGTPSGSWVNKLGVVFSAAGGMHFFALPGGLPLETGPLATPSVSAKVYLCNVSGQTFKVCSDPDGTSVINIIDVGTGPLQVSSTNQPLPFQLEGIKIMADPTTPPGVILYNGGTSALYNTPRNFKFEHSYIDLDPTSTAEGFQRAVMSDGIGDRFIDGWISGAFAGESQAVNGLGSPGPTEFRNTFLESGGEAVIYGGNWTASGITNANKIFIDNLFHRPPSFKVTINNSANPDWDTMAVTPTGTGCLADHIDPFRPGGEWLIDTVSGIHYQCDESTHTWVTTLATLPCGGGLRQCGGLNSKDLVEYKSGKGFTLIGNVMDTMFAMGQQGAMNWSAEGGFTGGSGPGLANTTLTLKYNAAYHIYSVMTRMNLCTASFEPCAVTPGNHAISDNLFVLTPAACGITVTRKNVFGCGYQNALGPSFLNNGMVSVDGQTAGYNDFIAHDSVYRPDAGYGTLQTHLGYVANSWPVGCPFTPIVFNTVNQFNIIQGDLSGNCVNNASALYYYDFSSFTSNLLYGSLGGYTGMNANTTFSNNQFPANNAAIGWNAAADGISTRALDYDLQSSSAYSVLGTCTTVCSDGRSIGADIHAISNATSGVYAGTPPQDRMANLTVSVGSTKVSLDYASPITGSCTATIYSDPGRATSVVTKADTDTTAVFQAKDRSIPLGTLSALTHYYGELVCGSSIFMPFEFTTKAGGSGSYNKHYTFSTSIAVKYGPNADMSMSTTLGAATNQNVPCSSDSFCYIQDQASKRIKVFVTP